tara:strand:+ start:4954 stop:6042 length:1089 start_codon:yes stop_codon:yes gene_type:complete
MNSISKLTLSLLCLTTSAWADNPVNDAIVPQDPKNPILESLWDPARVDSHAPIGVMGDHTHSAGEIMLSYRYMQMAMGGHRSGTDSLSSQEVYHRGFGAAATQMDMHMHMFGMMYAPSDWLTLMAMVNYIEKDMHLVAAPATGHGHGHGGGHAHTGTFGHSSAGAGDVTLGGLIKIYDANRQRIHLNLSLGLPTADVDEMQDGVFLPYGMQLGRGTWNIRPGLTYLGQTDRLSWGAQAIGTFDLEEENDSGFSYGNNVNTTAWLAIPLTDCLSISGRINYFHEDAIDGHYNGAHNHVAPPHFQPNYGGDYLDGGLGLNFYASGGFFQGHRLALEWLFPLYQDLNGVGMERDHSFVVGWQKSF